MKETRHIIVIDDRKDWSPEWHGYRVLAAAEYFSDDNRGSARAKVINLCRHRRKLSTGYFVSLLAEARGHRVLAAAPTLHSLTSRRIYADELDELRDLVQKSLARLIQDQFVLSVYFGRNVAERHTRLSQRLFSLVPCPLFRVEFSRHRQRGWEIRSIKPLGLSEVPQSHLPTVKKTMDAFLNRRWTANRSRGNTGYDLAVLHDPGEKQPPSDPRALKQFIRAGRKLGLNVECITRIDYPRLLEFDALFIRETTSMGNHTYRFAARAQREGMAVIDDPDSIRRCCNKVYLHELLRKNRIRTPKTAILHANNIDRIAAELGFPIVVKIPDSAFSLGVFKVDNEKDLRHTARTLLKASDLLLAQEFLPTDFDWRVGILNEQPLFVCRYYMTREHWQIYRHRDGGRFEEGESDALAVNDAPANVVRTALAAARLIGRGLYGVDLKQRGRNIYVIEINDNPNIETGVEDAFLKDALYERIMAEFLNRIEKTKHP